MLDFQVIMVENRQMNTIFRNSLAVALLFCMTSLSSEAKMSDHPGGEPSWVWTEEKLVSQSSWISIIEITDVKATPLESTGMLDPRNNYENKEYSYQLETNVKGQAPKSGIIKELDGKPKWRLREPSPYKTKQIITSRTERPTLFHLEKGQKYILFEIYHNDIGIQNATIGNELRIKKLLRAEATK